MPRRIFISGIVLLELMAPRFVSGAEAARKNAEKNEQNLRQALAQAQALNEEAAKINRSEAAVQWYLENAEGALVYLTRAIHFAPQSSLAAEQAAVVLSAWKIPPVVSTQFESGLRVLKAQFSSDGNYLLTYGYREAKGDEVQVWKAKTGEPVPLKGSGKEDTTTGDRRVTLLDGQEIQFSDPLDDRIKDLVGFGPPSGSHANAAKQAAGVWNKIVSEYAAEKHDGDGAIPVAAFSPDHRRIVTAHEDLRVWDAATGRLLLTFYRPVSRFDDRSFLSARYSPDGSHILSVIEKRPASIWDAATGSLVAVLRSESKEPDGKRDAIYAAFSPDGRQVVTASIKGMIKIWTLSSPDAAPPPLLPTNAGPPPEWFIEFLNYMAERRSDKDGWDYVFRGYDLRSMRDHLQSVLNAAGDSKSPYFDMLRYYLKFQADNERSE